MAAGDWKDLISAIQNGDLDLVKYHTQSGVNLNYQHPEYLTTPLIESVNTGHFEITKYLLENGADVKLKAGFSNDSPLSMARKSGNKRIIRLLKSHLPKRNNFFSKLLKTLNFQSFTLHLH